MAHPGGRPLKFKNKRTLERKIKAYFDSLLQSAYYKIPKQDSKGKNIPGEYTYKPKIDPQGNHIKEYTETPTITGLAVFLDTSRETLMNYEEKEEFFDTIKKAKELIEYFVENDKYSAPALKIFKMKNFGWVDKVEVENTPNDDIESVKDQIKELIKRNGFNGFNG